MRTEPERRVPNIIDRPVELAIVGGGAAGLHAAAHAADIGVKALLFERKARPGAKMLMTANGRCNFTKDISPERMLADIGDPVASFVRPALMAFPPTRVAAEFKAHGLGVKRMTDGRLFPASEKAADVVHVFGDRLRERGAPMLVNCPVTGLSALRNGFILATPAFTVRAANVLITTGGVSFPKTGSTGDGFEFARRFGIAVTPPAAGLTGVDWTGPRTPRTAAGRRHENAVGRVLVGGAARYEWRGEVEFDRTGVSGAAVYNCQRWAARHATDDWTLVLSFDGERLEIPRPKVRSVKEAIVTLGGVSRDAVDPATMQAREVPGLYFAGETLDIDGPTGGYNLTLAFATARLAVESVKRAVKR